MKNYYVTLGSCVMQYRDEIWVDDTETYGQITISNTGTISHRGTKLGGSIGRKRQFVVNLKTHPNTLTFTRQGIYDGAIGFAPPDTDGCIATENMPLFSLKPGISREYIEQLLLSPIFKGEVRKLAPKGAAQKSIHERQLLEVLIPLPALESQIEIADIVAKERQAIASLKHEITHQQSLLAKLKQAILQEAIQGKLTADWRAANPDVEPASQLLQRIQAEKARLIAAKKLRPEKSLPKITDNEIPFEIPKGWVWCRLNDAARFSNGDRSTNYPSGSELKESGVPFINSKSIHDGIVDLSQVDVQYITEAKFASLAGGKFRPLDIVMVLRGSGRGKSGILFHDDPRITGFINAQLIIIRGLADFIPEFFRVFLESSFFFSQVDDVVGGSAQPHISGKSLQSVLLALPPLAEQAAIVERVEALMATCRALEAEIEQSRAHAAHLLQAVLKEAFAPAS
jgi:type I restriction enzyme S subunit